MKPIRRSLLWAFSAVFSALMVVSSFAFLSAALDAVRSGTLDVGIRGTRDSSSGYLWFETFKYADQPIFFSLHLVGYISGFVGLLSTAAMIAMMLWKHGAIVPGKVLRATRLGRSIVMFVNISGTVWVSLFFGLRALFAAGVFK
jgi:hypothetical protein